MPTDAAPAVALIVLFAVALLNALAYLAFDLLCRDKLNELTKGKDNRWTRRKNRRN